MSRQLAIHGSGPKHPGDEPPIVIFHGVPGTMSYFSRLIAALSPTRQVLFVDMPGYGDSPMPHQGYTMDSCAGLIEDALLAHGVGSIDVIGHSVGAYRALAIALRGRVQIHRAVLHGPVAGLDDADRARYRQFAQLLQAPPEQVDLRSIWLGVALNPEFIALHPSEAEEVAAQLTAPKKGVLEIEFRAMAESEDLRARLHTLGLPMVVRVGDRDASAPSAWSEAIVSRVPMARLERVPGCSHMLLLEDGPATIRSALAALSVES